MTVCNSRITSFFSISEEIIRLVAILALVFLLFFLWTGVAQAAPVQSNPLQVKKAASGMHVSVKKHRENTKKQVCASKKAHTGKADDKRKRTVIGKGRSKKHAGELSRKTGKKGEKAYAPSHERKRYSALIALGKNSRPEKRGNEPAQGPRRNIRIHAGPSDDFTSSSAEQREAFEKQLLMEGPLDEQTLNIIESAYSYMGTRYQWGGTTPDGFDCSGFVRYVFRENGIPLGRSSQDQVLEGKAVPLSELRPGDLVFFKFYSSRNRERNKGRVNHVGLYLGNGRFIHAASNPCNRAITVNELASGKYFSRIVEVRRILDASED